jgi:hypothetical protein
MIHCIDGWLESILRQMALLLICGLTCTSLMAMPNYVSTAKQPGFFTLAEPGVCAVFVASRNEHPGVLRVLDNLQADFIKVTAQVPPIVLDEPPAGREVVLIGTLGKSPLIDRLIAEKKLDPAGLAGRWETFVTQIVDDPLPGLGRALVIAGSDKRGTIYGLYDLSSQIGISAWHFWSDVPPRHHDALYVIPGRHTLGEPKVKYRGLFINDEAPALTGWAFEKFGGFNARMYEHVFDLILRMKGNYLWPAMWGRMFYVEDPLNPQLADEYGIVIATSHHEPMMRAHAEWAQFGSGKWNYEANEKILQEFWREGIKRMGSYESVVTVGMRGDGDEPMSEAANIALLERIVRDQRRIIEEVTQRPAEQTPQVWALYKEVQEYYDKGMRVPEDVTLLLCDDNWGNLRKLPRPGDPPRKGGYGIYYHFDYVGGPRNYKWLNTNQVARVWEQMHLAYEMGARKIWIVNVGDIKPMELPTEFFFDYAWNPDDWPAGQIPEYTRGWAERQFGPEYAASIARMLESYTRFNSRRKPELLEPATYSLSAYQEWERIAGDYRLLANDAQSLNERLPAEQRPAFYQIVLHPVTACANLNELYYTVAKNRLYARQGRAMTNTLAERSAALFAEDARISDYYNRELAEGKWNHMMDQTHIGYTYWQQPDSNSMPEVKRITLPPRAELGVAIEGSEQWWPDARQEALLPELDPHVKKNCYIDLFNRGRTQLGYSIKPGRKWLHIDVPEDTLLQEKRVWLTVDWLRAPRGKHRIPITLTGSDGRQVVITARIHNPAETDAAPAGTPGESNGYIALEAAQYTCARNSATVYWQEIPELGRTLSGITLFPVMAAAQTPGGNAPHLEYRVNLTSSGAVTVRAFLSPTLDFHNSGGLRYAVSFNDEAPQIISMHSAMNWEKWVSDNIAISSSTHQIGRPGTHVLKFWAVDPGVVLQRLVIETGGAQPSYLGPPATFVQSAGEAEN